MTRRSTVAALAALPLLGIALPAGSSAGSTPPGEQVRTAVVSVDRNGGPANAGSGVAKVSHNGNRVAFVSFATDLVGVDIGDYANVFARTRSTGRTQLVTRTWTGEPTDGPSRVNGVSRTGRFVAYDSAATNIARRDTNGVYDIFVRDLEQGRSERISVTYDGKQPDRESFRPSLSGNGRIVVYDSYATNLVPHDTNGGFDVFLRNRQTDTTRRISVGPGGLQADGESTGAVISADGGVVCYESGAENLVANDGNDEPDVFCYDRATRTTELASVALDGTSGVDNAVMGDVSADGRFVVFTSLGNDYVEGDGNGFADVFVRDLQEDSTVRVSLTTAGAGRKATSFWPSISADGSVVTFDTDGAFVPGDTNTKYDVYRHRLTDGTTRRVSVADDGAQGSLASLLNDLSGDGRFVVFLTDNNFTAGADNHRTDVMIRGPLSP